jgi:hypothetical protein
MDFDQLIADLGQLGVSPIDPLRASLYIDYLNQARTHFFVTLSGPLPGGLGGDYAFARKALCNPKLLKELADILDYYVSPAIEAEMTAGPNGALTYRQYFDNVILDATRM